MSRKCYVKEDQLEYAFVWMDAGLLWWEMRCGKDRLVTSWKKHVLEYYLKHMEARFYFWIEED